MDQYSGKLNTGTATWLYLTIEGKAEATFKLMSKHLLRYLSSQTAKVFSLPPTSRYTPRYLPCDTICISFHAGIPSLSQLAMACLTKGVRGIQVTTIKHLEGLRTSPATFAASLQTLYWVFKTLKLLRQEPTSSAQIQVRDNFGPSQQTFIRNTKGLNPSKNKLALREHPVLTPART